MPRRRRVSKVSGRAPSGAQFVALLVGPPEVLLIGESPAWLDEPAFSSPAQRDAAWAWQRRHAAGDARGYLAHWLLDEGLGPDEAWAAWLAWRQARERAA